MEKIMSWQSTNGYSVTLADISRIKHASQVCQTHDIAKVAVMMAHRTQDERSHGLLSDRSSLDLDS